MKKVLPLIIALFALSSYTITAYASSPPRAQDIEVKSFNFTQGCEYIDVLIQLSEDDSDYTAYNEVNMKQCSFDTKKLSEYRDNDGYISMSCHFKDNYTRMIIKKQEYGGQTVSLNSFVLDDDKVTKSWRATDRMYDLFNRSPLPKFKVAVLDNNGDIIQTSKPFELKNDTGYLWNNVNYDVAKNTIELDWEKAPTILEKTIHTIIFIIVVAVVPVAIAAKLGLLFFNRKKRKAEKELKQV